MKKRTVSGNFGLRDVLSIEKKVGIHVCRHKS
jgi:hypothetical protein